MRSFVLLEAINAGLGLLGAWMLTGLFARGWTRHAAVLMLLATPLYTVMAFKYNANTILVSLWPWTLYFFVKSLDCMKARDAAVFGAFAALCILSKYYTVDPADYLRLIVVLPSEWTQISAFAFAVACCGVVCGSRSAACPLGGE